MDTTDTLPLIPWLAVLSLIAMGAMAGEFGLTLVTAAVLAAAKVSGEALAPGLFLGD